MESLKFKIESICENCSHYKFCKPKNNEICSQYDGWFSSNKKPKPGEYLVLIDNQENGIYKEISEYKLNSGWISEICNYTVYDKKVIAWRNLPNDIK